MQSASVTRYVKRCNVPSCGITLQVLNAFCKNCGFVRAEVRSGDPAASGACACTGCGATLADVAPPPRCQVCDNGEFRWWDSQDQAWLQPDLRPTEAGGTDGVWLTGEFSADLSGPQTSESVAATGLRRNYRSPIRAGKLLNPRRVDGPPLALADDEQAPLREAAVGNVLVHFGADGNSIARVTLLDLRVHRWRTDGTHELNTSSASLGHRAMAAVSGTAYGFLQAKPHEAPNNEPFAAPLASPSMPPPAVSPVAGAVGGSGMAPSGADTPTAPESRPDCGLCSWWWAALLALGFLVLCGWKEAVFGVLFPLALLCWFSSWIPKRFRSTSDALGAIPVAIGALAVGWVTFKLATTGCALVPSWLPALLWFALAIGALFTQCWVRSSLICLWLVVLGIHCTGISSACRVQAETHGPRVPQREMQANQPASPRTSPSSMLEEVSVGLQSAVNELGNWIQAIAFHDQTAETLVQATGDLQEGRLMTIDQALAKPQSISDCKTAIYFPSAAMFEFNSSQINPEVERQLAKLDRLREKLPGRELVITGHADKVGAYTQQGVLQNIILSEQRAAAVSEWLSSHTGWQPSQMEALGAGSKFPLIDKDGDVPLNRRVEVRLRCRTGATQ